VGTAEAAVVKEDEAAEDEADEDTACLFLYALYGAKGCPTIRLGKVGTSSRELPGALNLFTLTGAASMRRTHKAKRTRRLRRNDWFINIIVVVQ